MELGKINAIEILPNINKEYEEIAKANNVTVEQAKQAIPEDTVAYHIQKNLAVELLKKNNGPKAKVVKETVEE